jgi:isatin hydrolase
MTTDVSSSAGRELASLLASRKVIDLTALLSPEYPSATAIGVPFLRHPFNFYNGVTPAYCGTYADHILVINEHTGTHCDVPPHLIPDISRYPDLPNAAEIGAETMEKVEVERFMGPADVIDVRDLIGTAAAGQSPIISVERVRQWEAEHGDVQPGDVVLFYTSWMDRHYKRFPEGYALDLHPRWYGQMEGWAAPDTETMTYIVDKGVRCVGFDTVSTGSIQDDAPPHIAALSRGTVLVEKLIGLGQLPARGAFFMFLPIKVERGTGSPGRAIAIV